MLTLEGIKFFAYQIEGFKKNYESLLEELDQLREQVDKQIEDLRFSYFQKHRKSRPFQPGANCLFNNYYEKKKEAGPEGVYIDWYNLFTKLFKPKTKGIKAVEIYEHKYIIVPDLPSEHTLSEKFKDFENHPYFIQAEIIKNNDPMLIGKDNQDGFKRFQLHIYVDPINKASQDEETITKIKSAIWKLRNQIPEDLPIYCLIRNSLGELHNTKYEVACKDSNLISALNKFKVLEAISLAEKGLTVEEAIRDRKTLKFFYDKYDSKIKESEKLSGKIEGLEANLRKRIQAKRNPFIITFQWWDNKNMLRAFPSGQALRKFKAMVKDPLRGISPEDSCEARKDPEKAEEITKKALRNFEDALRDALGKDKTEDGDFWAGYLPEFWGGEWIFPSLRKGLKAAKADLSESCPNLVLFQDWKEAFLQIGIYAHRSGLLSNTEKGRFIEEFWRHIKPQLKTPVRKVFLSSPDTGSEDKSCYETIFNNYNMPYALNQFWNYVRRIYAIFYNKHQRYLPRPIDSDQLEYSAFHLGLKLGVSTKTVYTWYRRNKIKAERKDGGKSVFGADAYHVGLELKNKRIKWRNHDSDSNSIEEFLERFISKYKVPSLESAKRDLRRMKRDFKQGKLSDKRLKRLKKIPGWEIFLEAG